MSSLKLIPDNKLLSWRKIRQKTSLPYCGNERWFFEFRRDISTSNETIIKNIWGSFCKVQRVMKSCFILVSQCLGPIVFYETSQGFNIIVPDQKTCSKILVEPLSPNSDQDQFSPINIHTLSTDKLWELIKWSPK